MINNRQQAGRRRGRGGGTNNGGPRQGNPGRPDNGNRIDSRARGNASQLYEKYKSMASDAQRQGDRVNTEYYLQFADHYFRVLSEQRGRVDEQQPRRQRDDFDFDGAGEFGDEFGDEGEAVRAKEQWGEQGGEPQRFDRDDRGRDDQQGDGRQAEGRQGEGRQGSDRQRDDRPRDDRPRAEARDDRPRAEARDDRPRGEGRGDRPRAETRDDRPRAETRDNQPRAEMRDDRPRGDRDGARREATGDTRPASNGDGRPRGEWQDREPRRSPGQNGAGEAPPVEVAGQRRADPMVPGESLENRAEEVLEADRPLDAPPARRRGRPRRDAEPVAANGTGGIEPSGLEADRLPPSLIPPSLTPTSVTAANDEARAEVKPRRRRARPAEDTPDAAE